MIRGRIAGHLWEQLELPSQLRGAGCECALHMGGTAPIVARGHVFVVHDLLPLTHAEWFTRRFRAWRAAVLRAAIPRAYRIVTVSDAVRDEIARLYPGSADRIVVAHQGTEPFDAPASGEAVAALRRRYALPPDFLLAVGAGDPRKNLPFLGQVLARWGQRGLHPPPLVVVGAPAPGLFTAESGWPAGIDLRMLGRVDDEDLRALYTAAAALCFPSLAEGFGRPPLEAIACGTPAIVAPYPAAREILGDAGLIVPLDPDSWVDALIGVLKDGGKPSTTPALASGFRWDGAAEIISRACEEAAEEGRRCRS